MDLLLLSNSANAGDTYLNHAKEHIKSFLGDNKIKVLFIPYAAVKFSYDDYETKVKVVFNELGYDFTSIHRYKNAIQAVENADVIVVGGGNTWQLNRLLKVNKLMRHIKKAVRNGTKYIGWSAGSNVACPTMQTTNDMPIIDPRGMKALKLIPFQINPHYMDANPEGHAGETREMRIEEFIEVNRDVVVVGLREGSMFRIEGNSIELLGSKSARIFEHGKTAYELGVDDDFSFLMNRI